MPIYNNAATIQGSWKLECIQFGQLSNFGDATCLSYKCNKPISFSTTVTINGTNINAVSPARITAPGSQTNPSCPTTSPVSPLTISRQITGIQPPLPDGSQCFSLGPLASIILGITCVDGGPRLSLTGVKATPDAKDLVPSQCQPVNGKVASLPVAQLLSTSKLFCTAPTNSKQLKTKGSYNYQCIGFPLFRK